MNIKKKIILLYVISIFSFLTIINLKNPRKTNFYLFTTKIENISVGNLITLTFVSGYVSNLLLNFNNVNFKYKKADEKFTSDENIDGKDQSHNERIEYDRPPERDIRESQPTISVKYRFVETDNGIDTLKKSNTNNFNLENDTNDWSDIENDW